MRRAGPDGACICDSKPLAMAGPDVREILIYFMQISLGPFHKLTVGAERWSISQVVSPKHFPLLLRVSRRCLAETSAAAMNVCTYVLTSPWHK